MLRSVSRGALSFTQVAQNLLFQWAPVIMQIVIVCSYLLYNYNWVFSIVTLIVCMVYGSWTLLTAAWYLAFLWMLRDVSISRHDFVRVAGLIDA